MIRLLGTAIVVVLIAGPAGAAGPSPSVAPPVETRAVVKAVLDAPSLVDYEGTKVLTSVRDGRAETVTILESYKRLGKLRLEFLSPESLAGRLIIDDGASTWQYEPAHHLAVRGPSFVPSSPRVEPAQLLARYTATVLGVEQVIGRQTAVLTLTPKGGGHSRRVWVDQLTGVMLRTEERDATGEILFTSFFTRISYSLNLPSGLFRFHLPAGARVFSFYLSGDPVPTPAALAKQSGFDVIAPPQLPGGWRFREGTVARYGAFIAASARYTDGLSMLTLYQTPSARMAFPQVGAPVQLQAARGRLLDLGYFRVLVWQHRGLTLALIGTLPAPDAVAMADTLNVLPR